MNDLGMHLELLERILLATCLGAAIGYEREQRGRDVGLRTHTIVAMASATFMVVSTQFMRFQGYESTASVDGSRIASTVVSGIGFIAGGAILRNGLSVQGLTTAAGLWLVTAIGLAAGGGLYIEATVVTAMGAFVLAVIRRFEDKDDRPPKRRRVTLIAHDSPEFGRQLEAIVDAEGAVISNVGYRRTLARADRDGHLVLCCDVHADDEATIDRALEAVQRMGSLRGVRVDYVV